MFVAYIHSSTTHNNQKAEAIQISTDEETMWSMEYFSALKRKEILTYATIWNESWECHAKLYNPVTHTQKEIMHDST